MPDIPVWEDIRRAYETSADTVKDILARYQVKSTEFYARRSAEKWTPRPMGTECLLIANAKRAAKKLENSLSPSPLREGERVGVRGSIPTDADAATPYSPIVSTKSARNTGGNPTHRRAIMSRLYYALDASLAEIEMRLSTKTKLTATDAEREARHLASITKQFENLNEIADLAAQKNATAKSTTATASTLPDTAADDAERFRQDITERFTRLQKLQTVAQPAD